MAFVLISWMSISMVFCLALVRAGARRCFPGQELAEAPNAAAQVASVEAKQPQSLPEPDSASLSVAS